MHSTLVFLFSILPSLISANPVPQTANPPPGKDQCGPTIQVPGDPVNTCAPATPDPEGGNPIFGITPISPPGNPPNLNWHVCDDLVERTCQRMTSATLIEGRCDDLVPPTCQRPTYEPPIEGEWYFDTSVSTGLKPNTFLTCQVSFWVEADVNAAKQKDNEQCKHIFQTMLLAAAASQTWGGASINLKSNPDSRQMPGAPLALPNGSGTGSQYNSGYPSYVIQLEETPGASGSDSPDGRRAG
ncbi:MAG: hypothetical protein Q9224_006280 [Gallowayella concinna]